VSRKKAYWKDLVEELRSCERCPLHRRRNRVVPGEGNLSARLMFVGEGPGREEDKTGRPFVGAAGAVLDSFFSRCGIQRKDVFITNTVRCNPPGNRDPSTIEILRCRNFLQRTIELVSPKVLVALGKHAAGSLTDRYGDPIWSLKEKELIWKGDSLEVPIVVMYHPAFILRELKKRNRKVVQSELGLLKQAVEKSHQPSIR